MRIEVVISVMYSKKLRRDKNPSKISIEEWAGVEPSRRSSWIQCGEMPEEDQCHGSHRRTLLQEEGWSAVSYATADQKSLKINHLKEEHRLMICLGTLVAGLNWLALWLIGQWPCVSQPLPDWQWQRSSTSVFGESSFPCFLFFCKPPSFSVCEPLFLTFFFSPRETRND